MANKMKKNQIDVLDDNCDVLVSSSEFIPGRLYFVVLRTHVKPKYTQNSHYFTIDDELIYDPFFEDFGPLNLALLYRYCCKLNRKLKAYSLLTKKIVHYTTTSPHKRVNAAYLVGSYAVIYLKMHPDEVFLKLSKGNGPAFADFRDASNGFAVYKISLLDCLNAIYQAHKNNFFDFEDFNLEEYEYYETVENGDLNWIVPNKFLAFAGPQSKSHIGSTGSVIGYPTHTPESYIKYFRENNVTTIVRLNNKLYDASKFTKEGFVHKDLFFFDGTTPSNDLVQKFLALSESTSGAVAVHCKAGLGRTGSMIACYIMKWYHFTARETIAWLRICRPASIIGHQQEWLEMKQSEMWSLHPKLVPKHKFGIYSIQAKAGDKGKTISGVKSVRSGRALPVDNVSRIVNKVDSMSIDNGPKDDNKNVEILTAKDPSNSENISANENSLTQGDRLNQIKASRGIHSRQHPHGRTARTPWSVNSVANSKRAATTGKINCGHQRRPLTRSKSSQGPSVKNMINETNKTAANSASSVNVSVSVPIGMTLRSNNRIYSLRHDVRNIKITVRSRLPAEVDYFILTITLRSDSVMSSDDGIPNLQDDFGEVTNNGRRSEPNEEVHFGEDSSTKRRQLQN